MCNILCQTMGHHGHVDDRRVVYSASSQIQHIQGQIAPNSERAKDWISHNLYWRRSGTIEFFLPKNSEILNVNDRLYRQRHLSTATQKKSTSSWTRAIFTRGPSQFCKVVRNKVISCITLITFFPAAMPCVTVVIYRCSPDILSYHFRS
jgi:hypothetical protein